MKMPDALPQPKPIGKMPMIMQLPPSTLIWVINQQLEKEGKPLLPLEANISVRIPGGGDYSNMDLELDERDIQLDIRWEQ